MAQLAAQVTLCRLPRMYAGFSSKFSESDIGLRHKDSFSCITTVSHLLDPENELVGCLQTVSIEHCGNSCSTKLTSFTPSTVRKSTGRGCDRYPSVNGTLVETEMGPGQPRLDSGSPQQAGFPYQMLSQGFWAATHLPLAVRLRCP